MAELVKKDDYVKLISAEGFEFVIHKEMAMVSGTLKGMLGASGELSFPEISTPILEKLCQYFYYKVKYSNPANQKTIPEFKIEPEIALELHMVANYMET